MTREDAKEKLYMEWQKFLEDNIDYAGISEAYKMAIEALEQESKMVHRETLEQVMWERDVAINQLKELGYEFGEKIRTDKDAITRKAAIEALDKLCDRCEYSKKQRFVMCGACHLGSAFDVIEELPSVSTEKTGHNCNEDYADCDQFVCSECGVELQDWNRIERDEDDGEISYHEYTFNYCPSCGAKMAESEE